MSAPTGEIDGTAVSSDGVDEVVESTEGTMISVLFFVAASPMPRCSSAPVDGMTGVAVTPLDMADDSALISISFGSIKANITPTTLTSSSIAEQSTINLTIREEYTK